MEEQGQGEDLLAEAGNLIKSAKKNLQSITQTGWWVGAAGLVRVRDDRRSSVMYVYIYVFGFGY